MEEEKKSIRFQELEALSKALGTLNGVKTSVISVNDPDKEIGRELRALIFLRTNNFYSLSIITRVFDRRYSSTNQEWRLSLDTDDAPEETGKYPLFSVCIEARYSLDNANYFVVDCETLIDNIKHWTQPMFDNYFKRYHFDINI